MTLDDVVLRTAATLGVVVVIGAVAWIADLQGLAIVGALVGFVLALIIAFKQSTNPALILAYAAAEGVFLGAISRAFNETVRWRDRHPGGRRHDRRVRRHAGRLQDRRDPGHAEVHPLAARRAHRRRRRCRWST